MSWIGDPSARPLALIHGSAGTFAITKNVIVIGRETNDSDTDLNFQVKLLHFLHPKMIAVRIFVNCSLKAIKR